ncbi:MAG TPA: DUF4097 family beta strand repeat-containing protein [Vicinamibacteria bacterium]
MSLRRRSFAFVFALFALPGQARAGDVWDAWASIFADFFLGPETREEFRWHGPVASGGTVEIKGVNGAIRAEPAAGNDVEIVALKRGRRNSPRDVQVKVVPHDGGLTICAVYPTSGFGPANECQPGSGGRMNVRNNDVSVDFTVRVPAGSDLVARTVNGSVQASGLRGRVEAHTVNGSVKLSTEGAAEAETVNGSIDAALGRTDWKDSASFQTVNGSITLALPRAASTAVEARTVNGRIAVDFELAGARTGRREVSGTIGAGGRRLALATVNGGIRVRREN